MNHVFLLPGTVRALDFISVVAILVAVIAAPFLLIGWSNYLSRRPDDRVFPIKSTLFFAVPVIIGLLGGWTSDSIAQFEVLQFLESVSNKSIISINGKEVQNGDEILNTLKGIQDLPAHHSSPTRMIYVDISDQPRHLLLWVARDSSDPHEYWVFAPSPSKLALRSALKKDIGHVITSVFDQY